MPTAPDRIFDPLRSLFFPAHCAHCACRVEGRMDLCPDCAMLIERITDPRCEACSQPFDGAIPGKFVCPNCRNAQFSFQCAVAVVRSQRTIRDLVHRLKYGHEMWLGRVLAEIQREGLDDPRLADGAFDALVPVPLHPRRQRERGFNQAAILAGHLSRFTEVPAFECLRRSRYTNTQTLLGRKGRRQNLRDAFALRPNANVAGMDLLLVDDVLTTGSTLDACASILLANGARSVRALTVARG